MPAEKREAVQAMQDTHGLLIKRGCVALKCDRSAYYQAPIDWQVRDQEIIDALNKEWRNTSLGHLEIYPAVARSRTRLASQTGVSRLSAVRAQSAASHQTSAPETTSLPVFVPEGPNEVWSADFMSDTLYHGSRFRTFSLIDDFNREALAIEIDTSLCAERIVRVWERLKAEQELSHIIRGDNGPEFLAQALHDWGKANRVLIYHIQPGCPTQNAFIERFNRTYRHEVLDLYLFRSLEDVREITATWMTIYNEYRPHEALQGAIPCTYHKPTG